MDPKLVEQWLRLTADDRPEHRWGSMLEVGFAANKHVRMGVGYNWSRFSDDELYLERDSHGMFVRLTGQY